MARPKGSKNKPKEEVVPETVNENFKSQPAEVINANVREEKEEREEVLKAEAPNVEPLGPGQKYFEAPDGTMLIGEATANQIWYRNGNGGKGMWVNPKR